MDFILLTFFIIFVFLLIIATFGSTFTTSKYLKSLQTLHHSIEEKVDGLVLFYYRKVLKLKKINDFTTFMFVPTFVLAGFGILFGGFNSIVKIPLSISFLVPPIIIIAAIDSKINKTKKRYSKCFRVMLFAVALL
ncbi:TPA: hypothetical protein GXZ34_04470 [bacterium]|nr:hypothetical protein [bacterium]